MIVFHSHNCQNRYAVTESVIVDVAKVIHKIVSELMNYTAAIQ